MKKRPLNLFLPASVAFLAICPAVLAKPDKGIRITPVGSVAAGSFLTSAAEIVAYDPGSKRLFVVNAQAAKIDVIDIRQPSAPVLRDDLSIEVTPYGAVANSVAVYKGVIAVAVEADPKTDPGKVVFFDRDLRFVKAVEVGAQPDMLTFTPDGRYVLSADEGEPSDDYTVDPEGSVSVIDLSRGVARATVRKAGFQAFNAFSRQELFDGPEGESRPAVRVFGPGATVAQDFEPEYITISEDSKTAWVTLQENNAIAVLDIRLATVTSVSGLGTKDHLLADNGFGSSNALDASDKDKAIHIANWPVQGFYLPDAIASYKSGGDTILVLANEGDSRDWSGYSEEERFKSLNLDPEAFPAEVAAELKKDKNLGRLKVTTAQGDTGGNGIYKEVFSYGARSFSLRSSSGELLWDSGDQFERILAELNPDFFNSNHEENVFDSRSDDKGPEPEGVTVGKLWGRQYAFIALERIGGIMIYDVTDPASPEFEDYVNNRDFTRDPETPEAGDLGPEGLLLIGQQDSPNGKPLLVVANEVSGTTTVYEIEKE